MVEISSDVIRGYNDTIILFILLDEPSYGYEISKRIRALSEDKYIIKETTLYSAFTRMEKNGYVESYTQNAENDTSDPDRENAARDIETADQGRQDQYIKSGCKVIRTSDASAYQIHIPVKSHDSVQKRRTLPDIGRHGYYGIFSALCHMC